MKSLIRRKMSFDNGYFSGPNLRYLETNGLDGYIPDRKQAGEMKGNKPKVNLFSKDSFDYDEETDQFLCPSGEILSRKGEYEYNIKHNLKFREFLTRGIENVRIEHNLVCTAHNLKVILQVLLLILHLG